MEHIYCDFEFNERTVLLGCFLNADTGERRAFDFRQTEEVADFLGFVADNRDALWCAYSAMAEMHSFLRLGCSLSGLGWIDLMAEASMVSGTHSAFLLKRPRLLSHLDVFEVRKSDPESEARKEAMRDLILSDVEFTPEQWGEIVAYCWSDVEPLPDLHATIRYVHEQVGTGYDDAEAITRGEYLKASAILENRTRGLPVDVPFVERIFRDRDAVMATLCVRCNDHYGFPLYVYNHVTKRYSFSFAGLSAFLASLPYYIAWEKTPSGQLRTDDDYLDQLIKENPELKEFKRTRNTLAQLKSNELPSLVRDGFVKPASIPFYTVTGRNQPLVKGGFILNMPPWLRHVIRPEPGHVLIAADWSKQEIAIALALSSDEALRAAYESGDIYLALAIMAGAVPPDGTEESHPLERQAYKAVQLALGYGMGKVSLGRALYNDLNEGAEVLRITREDAQRQAEEIVDWHKRTFVDYWRFLNREANAARKNGFCSSRDRWLYFADHETKFTRVMNFPMQANGATCLREAVKMLAFETTLDVVCTLHDAIYIYCREEEAEAQIAQLKAVMNAAVERVIGDEVRVKVGVSKYRHDSGYYDKRGTETLQVVCDLLNYIDANGAPPPPEKPLPKRRKKVAERADEELFGKAA